MTKIETKKAFDLLTAEENLNLIGAKYRTVDAPIDIFSCLESMADNAKSAYTSILVNNPKELNLTILQTNGIDHFYLGFNGNLEIESSGIITVYKHSGSNTVGLSSCNIAFFKNVELVNNFLQSWFNNQKSNFFDFEGIK